MTNNKESKKISKTDKTSKVDDVKTATKVDDVKTVTKVDDVKTTKPGNKKQKQKDDIKISSSKKQKTDTDTDTPKLNEKVVKVESVTADGKKISPKKFYRLYYEGKQIKGKFCGRKPKQGATKAVGAIIALLVSPQNFTKEQQKEKEQYINDNYVGKTYNFYLEEYKSKKIHEYNGTRHKLDEPVTIKKKKEILEKNPETGEMVKNKTIKIFLCKYKNNAIKIPKPKKISKKDRKQQEIEQLAVQKKTEVLEVTKEKKAKSSKTDKKIVDTKPVEIKTEVKKIKTSKEVAIVAEV